MNYLEALKQGAPLSDLPMKYRTREVCEDAIGWNSRNICFIPKQFKTSNFYLKAVQINGWTLNYIPKKYITQDLCFEAVKRDVWLIDIIPEKYKTLDLCLQVFNKNNSTIEYIPSKIIKKNIEMFTFYLPYDIRFIDDKIKVGCEERTKIKWLHTTEIEMLEKHGEKARHYLPILKYQIKYVIPIK